MISTIPFTKMSGAGNDFVVVDNMSGALQLDKSRLAAKLCDRHFGVGADGLLILEPSVKADFTMLYHNADGSYGGMCGNGGRCVARYAHVAGIADEHQRFEALDTLYQAEVMGESVKLRMKSVNSLDQSMLLQIGSDKIVGSFVDTGSPHFVTECSDLDEMDVTRLGVAIRWHKSFEPTGCNVNFVSMKTNGELSVRTYERGVEAETLACGTGSVAAAIVFAQQYGLGSPVTLNVRSGEQLHVHFQRAGNEFTDIWLEGSAHIHFSGLLQYDSECNAIIDPAKSIQNVLGQP